MNDLSDPRARSTAESSKRQVGTWKARACFSFYALVLLWAGTDASAQDAKHTYVIQADFLPEQHRVDAHESVRFENTADLPIDHLLFHLYLNAFDRERRSVFMRESSGALRGDAFQTEGAIVVTEMRARFPDGHDEDLLVNCARELIPGDFTQLRAPLSRPLLPGQTLTLEIRFRSTLPRAFARSGYRGDFFVVAQWYPVLAKLEDDGQFAGFPYHGVGEFYADFATYDLQVTAPADYRLIASGEEVSPRRFIAKNVHDVVFVASRVHVSQHESVSLPGRSAVDVRYFYPPGYEFALSQHRASTSAALRYFSEHYGVYPYPSLGVVVPPMNASGLAGMEYPALFVTDGPPLGFSGAPIVLWQEVTVHELAHQWFQGILASNEVKHPFLDESLTEWATADFLDSAWGRSRSGISFGRIGVDGFDLRRLYANFGETLDVHALDPVARFSPDEYGTVIYARGPSVLETVARVWGRERFRAAVGKYARTFRFAHPTPEDFFDSLSDSYGEWLPLEVLRPMLEHSSFPSVSIESVSFGENSATLRALRRGAPVPVDVVFRGPNGVEHVVWPGREPVFEVTRSGVFTEVELDPYQKLLTDSNRRDQVRKRPEDASYSHAITFAAFLEALFTWVSP